MARVLHMQERRVSAEERPAYRAGLDARRAQAAAAQAHFWVFEHAADEARVLEFTEAASADVLRMLVGQDIDADHWRALPGA
ncbi:MAG: hypothetical protein LCH84_12555 [Gemmatimonadetes bacterium]|nr:hypothetical protein [Gemmatimonadota bacterium]